MNSFTRVAISVLLLGASAIAMRLSMIGQSYEAARKQEVQFGLAVQDKLKLHLEARFVQDLIRFQKHYVSGVSMSQTTNNKLLLNSFENSVVGKNQLIDAGLLVDHAHRGIYIFGEPKFDSPLLVQLPLNIPIEINAFVYAPKLDLDFRGLQISKFDLNPGMGSATNSELRVVVSDVKSKSQLILRSVNQPVEIKIPKGARGTLGLQAKGKSSIRVSIEKGVNPRIIIYQSDKNLSPSIHTGFSPSLSNSISFDGEKVVLTRWGRVIYEVPRKENLSTELYKPSEPKFDYTIRIVVDAEIQKIEILEVEVL